MKYDKYLTKETLLNCKNQKKMKFIISSYYERTMHELNLLTEDRT